MFCGTSNSTLTGHHDWDVIALNFRPFGDSADGAINPVTEPEPDLQDLISLKVELNTTDLQIIKTDSPDPVEAGDELSYMLMVKNNGPNPANLVRVTDVLPGGVSYVINNAGCTQAPAGTVTCELGEMAAFATRSISITVEVDSIQVDPATGPSIITNNASVENLAGPDSVPGNNNSVEDTTVIDTTPPVLTIPSNVTFEAGAQCTATGDIGMATATDIADPHPVIANDSTGVYQLGDNEVVWTATDASGNSVSASQIVTVIDVTTPVISLTLNPEVSWPPNHKMTHIVPTITVSDNCSVAGYQLETITMNEGDETNTYDPGFDNTPGDGHTVNDIQVNSDGTIDLRAERSGRGDGRVYSLTYSVTDGSGNRAEAAGQVTVPHNQ